MRDISIKKLVLLIALSAVLTSLVSAASVQHHPFSEIFPPDVNLDFGGKDIEDVSEIETSIISPNQSDIEFRDDGDFSTLVWDNSEKEWRLNSNSNFNVGGNNITQVDEIKFQTGMEINGSINTSGGDLNLDNGSISDVYSINGGGNPVQIRDVIEMNSNSINGANNLYFDSGDAYLVQDSDGSNLYIQADDSTGNRENYIVIDTSSNTVNISGSSLAVDGTTDGVDLDSPGNAISLSGGQYQISSGTIGSNELGSNAVTSSGGELDSSVAGNQLSYNSGSLEVAEGSGSSLNADQLDGVELANINWGDTAMAQTDVSKGDIGLGNVENIALSNAGWSDIGISQTDVSVSDLGAADSNLNMNGNTVQDADVHAVNGLRLPTGSDAW